MGVANSISSFLPCCNSKRKHVTWLPERGSLHLKTLNISLVFRKKMGLLSALQGFLARQQQTVLPIDNTAYLRMTRGDATVSRTCVQDNVPREEGDTHERKLLPL